MEIDDGAGGMKCSWRRKDSSTSTGFARWFAMILVEGAGVPGYFFHARPLASNQRSICLRVTSDAMCLWAWAIACNSAHSGAERSAQGYRADARP